MNLWCDIAGAACFVSGLFFLFVSAIGVYRLPDVYCRAHALGKAMTLGVILLLLSLGFLIENVPWWKLVVAIVFQLITIPVASHLLCLIGYRRKVRRWSSRGWTQD
ncbi:MAG: monovalent cation/H(+) antiporter subunit G [Opitutaceae bacterium]|nr:monovalent cation/H(+) antiporter subunit G [Opitutaceae bacterium]